MTITHEATPEPESAPKEAKPKRSKKAVEPTPAAVPSTTEQPATEPTATEPTDEPKPKLKKPGIKKVAKGPAPEMTLSDLADHYMAHLTATKSAGTSLSYKMELDRAVSYLGADTMIGTLTHFDIARFNGSRVVMCKKDGKPKAAPSYLKTQRVLRLCLVWAATDRRWLDSAPIPQDEADSK